MQNLQYNTNQCIYKNRLTDIENRLAVTKGEEDGKGGKDWEFGISRA